MVVGRRDGVLAEVVGTRAEAAENKIVALEGLVDRRRLVVAADNRLEVVDAEGVGIVVAVPADDVAGVVCQRHLGQQVALLDDDGGRLLLVDRPQIFGHAPVALAEGRALDELAVLVAVALRRAYFPLRFGDEEALLALAEAVAVQDSARDDEIVALRIRQLAEGGFERPAPVADVDDFVSLRVAVVELVFRVGKRHPERDVVVEHNCRAVEYRASAALQLAAEEVAHAQALVGVLLQPDFAQQFSPDHRRRPVEMVEQRRGSDEPLVALQLLVVDAAFRLAQRHVPLLRQLAQSVVAVHQRLPRSACSASIASNSALKLPCPKPRDPLRWMIS